METNHRFWQTLRPLCISLSPFTHRHAEIVRWVLIFKVRFDLLPFVPCACPLFLTYSFNQIYQKEPYWLHVRHTLWCITWMAEGSRSRITGAVCLSEIGSLIKKNLDRQVNHTERLRRHVQILNPEVRVPTLLAPLTCGCEKHNRKVISFIKLITKASCWGQWHN